MRKNSARTIPLTALIFLCAFLSGCGYNSLSSQDEQIKASWSEVLNQYQRRADLVPNLVSTVKGYATHEKELFENVAAARSKVGELKVSLDSISDPKALEAFQEAQGALTGSLSRLMAVSENYPQLKADGSFRDLQAQLEGTENRIAVARKRYIDSVREYNTTVRSFPSNLTAKLFGFTTKANLAVENEKAISTPPAVSF